MDYLQLLVNFFSHFGENPLFSYALVFTVLIICGFGVPIPEDISLVAGGVIAALGYANVHLMFLVCLLGVLLGDSTMFLLGRAYGEKVRHLPLVARFLTPSVYATVQQKFDRYGNRVLFIARFLPGLRAPIYLSAGMSRRVSFWRFVAFDGLAALVSVPIWVYLGFYGADNRVWLMTWVSRGQSVILSVMAIVAFLAVAFWLFRRYRSKRASAALQDKALRESAEAGSPLSAIVVQPSIISTSWEGLQRAEKIEAPLAANDDEAG